VPDAPTIAAWLHGVTYRPGWLIHPGVGTDVIIWATGTDACNPDGTFEAGPIFPVPERITSREQFLDWLMDECIPGIEQHERMEWFRVDGEKHRDPHAPGLPAFAHDLGERTAP
jgi:hypothetical protein